jgi:hypothetical protein
MPEVQQHRDGGVADALEEDRREARKGVVVEGLVDDCRRLELGVHLLFDDLDR